LQSNPPKPDKVLQMLSDTTLSGDRGTHCLLMKKRASLKDRFKERGIDS